MMICLFNSLGCRIGNSIAFAFTIIFLADWKSNCNYFTCGSVRVSVQFQYCQLGFLPSGELRISSRLPWPLLFLRIKNAIRCGSLVALYRAMPRDYLSDTPLLRAMGFLVAQHGQLGAIPPPPFLSVSPLEHMRSGGAIPPPSKGVSQRYFRDTL